MSAAEKAEKTEKVEAREVTELEPGEAFAAYVAATEDAGPCIVQMNSRMKAEIIDAGYQEINTDRTFVIDEELEDLEFVTAPLNKDVVGKIEEDYDAQEARAAESAKLAKEGEREAKKAEKEAEDAESEAEER